MILAVFGLIVVIAADITTTRTYRPEVTTEVNTEVNTAKIAKLQYNN